jgi:chaperonin cofactor prefoldin
MSNENLNMYQQIVDMELHDLENKRQEIAMDILNNGRVMDEMWAYHPSNPNFINPIKGYDELKKLMVELENKLNDIELKIKTLKSTN